MPLSEEDKAEFAKLIADAQQQFIKDVLPTHLNAALKPVVDSIPTADSIKATFDSILKKDEPDTPPKGKGKGTEKVDPQVAALAAQIEDLRKANQAAQDEASRLEAARKQDRLDNAVRDALGKGGIDPRHVMKAMADLSTQERIAYNDQGQMVFRTPNAYGTHDEVTLEDGIPKYLKGDGAVFMPASNVQGTGGPLGGPAPSNGGRGPQMTTTQLENMVAQAFFSGG